MENWIKELLEKERKQRNIPLEVKKIGKSYYLYRSTTIWDSVKKKRKKDSIYLGKITEKGVIEKAEKPKHVRTIYEYGNAKALISLASDILPLLKEAFPDDYNEILAMSIVRLIRQTPIRLIKNAWEKLYLSAENEVSLSPNTLSEKLRMIGSDWASQKVFFEHLMSKSRVLLFDMSSIFSQSENLRLAEKGHNADHLYLKQINFVLFFSQDNKIPVMIKSLPGSVRDIKSLKNVLKEFNLISCIVILDRGFASYVIADLFEEKELNFILPLKRNFEIIDYEMPLESYFVYRKRGIKWGKKTVNGKILYLFEDVKMRAEEETLFITLMAEGKRQSSEFNDEMKKFGHIAILSNIDEDGETIYLLFKQREEVEVAFDAMKNEMENDKTYLSDDDAVRGYFFVSFLSLFLYYRILEILRKEELVGKISVNEVLLELSKVYLVNYGDGKMKLSDIPAKSDKISKLFDFELFPKILRS
jgi:transposase